MDSQEQKEGTEERLEALERLLATVDRLREPGGCPWDREQTVESMAPYMVEEAHELREAIESGDTRATVEEAGDCLVALSLIARIASEAGRFSIADAATTASQKLIRRHPHVFADATAESGSEVLETWEEIKKREREGRETDSSALAGVPKTLPSLQRAQRTCEKAVASGFAWRDARGALAKLAEEVTELEEACTVSSGSLEESVQESEQREKIEHELGDVLMAGAFFGQYLGLDPERICRSAIERFERRFRAMEQSFDGELRSRPLEELMRGWEAAKRSTD